MPVGLLASKEGNERFFETFDKGPSHLDKKSARLMS